MRTMRMDTTYLNHHRARLMNSLDSAIQYGKTCKANSASGQVSLFNDVQKADPCLMDTEPWTDAQRLAGEKESLGFYLTGHPLDAYDDRIAWLGTCKIKCLADFPDGRLVRFCGEVSEVDAKRSKAGQPWLSFRIEDRSGFVSSIVLARDYVKCAPLVKDGEVLMVKGKVALEEGTDAKVIVREVQVLDKIPVS